MRKTRGRRLKLVVTCRDYYWGLFKGRFWDGATLSAHPVETDPDQSGEETGHEFSYFADDEHALALALYLEHYQIMGRPVGNAAEQCRHPLLLRFFCEAYRGQEVGDIEDIRLKELFDRYWARKLESIAERMIQQGDERLQGALGTEVGTYLLTVAAYMLHHNVRAIPLTEMSEVTGYPERHGDPRSVYGRIRDEFIILEEQERGTGRRTSRQVAFVYEEFMEYVMARSLLRDWDRAQLSEEAILAEIEKLTGQYKSFAQILGVMVYLGVMLKEQRDLDLWPLLVHKGARWQKVVFEAIRKLPAEQLDTSVFKVMTELLNTQNTPIQVQVLDTLKVKRIAQAAPTVTVSLVCKLTAHRKEPIALRAALALGYMDTEQVLPVLIKTMDHRRLPIRKNAIKALARTRDERAIEPLIAVVKESMPRKTRLRKDGDWSVRPDLAEALRQLVPKDGDWGVRWGAEALGQLRDVGAVGALLTALLKDADWGVQRNLAEVLGQLGEAWVVEPLIVALQEGSDGERRGAAAALGELGDTQAVAPLIVALQDCHVEVQASVGRALGQLGDARAVEPLIATLQDYADSVRHNTIWTLGQLGDARAVEPLIATLQDQADSVRQSAAKMLGLFRDTRATGPLIAALKDRNKRVQQNVVEALGQLGNTAVESLIAALQDHSQQVRRYAAEALGQIGDARAVEPLITALQEEPTWVRGAMVEALGQLSDMRAVDPLIAVLREYKARRSVAKALGQLGDTRAVEPLIFALQEDHTGARTAIAEALGQLGDVRAVEPFMAVLQDQDYDIQQYAAEALR